jgi:ABC-type transporter Mla MlaB component
MIKAEPGRITIEVGVRLDNAQAVTNAVKSSLQGREVGIVFVQKERYDSSVLAAMLAWLRHAQHENIALFFLEVPEEVLDLAKLYGIQELLPVRA